MYLENIDGRGTYQLTLVDESGDKYQGEVEIMNMRENIEFLKLEK